MPPPHFGTGHPMQMAQSIEMGSVAMINAGFNNNHVNSSRYPGPPPPPLPHHPPLAPSPPSAPSVVSNGGGRGGAGEGNMSAGTKNSPLGDDQQLRSFSSSSSSSYTPTFPSGDTPASAARGHTYGSRGVHRGAMGNSNSSSSIDANFNEAIAPSSITDPVLRQQVQRHLQLQYQKQQQRERQHGGLCEQKQHIVSGSDGDNGAWPSMSNQWPDRDMRKRGPPISSGSSSFRGWTLFEGPGAGVGTRTNGAAGSIGAPLCLSSNQPIYPPFGSLGGGGEVVGGGEIGRGPSVTSTTSGTGNNNNNKGGITSISSGSSSDECGGDGRGSDDGSVCIIRSGDGAVSMANARKGRMEGNTNEHVSSNSISSSNDGDIKATSHGFNTTRMINHDAEPVAAAAPAGAANVTATEALNTVNGAAAVMEAVSPCSTPLQMKGHLISILSGGDVAVERTRHLLTSWHLWSLEGGGLSNSSSSSSSVSSTSKCGPVGESTVKAEHGQAKEDLRELANLIQLTLPPSVAAWAKSRGAMGGTVAATEEQEQVQSFLDMCVDDDGSAICSAVYSGGRLQLTLNSRFAAMYMTLEELETTVARDKLRPELVWRQLLSPECFSAYDEALCQAYFKGQNLGGEACEIIKCVDRFGLEMPCFMRLRIFASSQGAITASVIFMLPLQLSQLVEAS